LHIHFSITVIATCLPYVGPLPASSKEKRPKVAKSNKENHGMETQFHSVIGFLYFVIYCILKAKGIAAPGKSVQRKRLREDNEGNCLTWDHDCHVPSYAYIGTLGKSKLPKLVDENQSTEGTKYILLYNQCISHTEHFHPGMSYFGRRVEVLFDDGEKYSGVICGRDPQTKEWITRFEDGTEDKVADPSTDKDYTLL